MKTFAPLLHSYWYLFRGAGMTLLMAAAAVVPATLLGVVLALAQIFGARDHPRPPSSSTSSSSAASRCWCC